MSADVAHGRLRHKELLEGGEWRELSNDVLGRSHGVGELVWIPLDGSRRLDGLIVELHRRNLRDEVVVEILLHCERMSASRQSNLLSFLGAFLSTLCCRRSGKSLEALCAVMSRTRHALLPLVRC